MKYTGIARQVNPLREERARLVSYLWHLAVNRVYYPDVNPIKLGWIKALNRYNWDWFATLTFRDLPKPFIAVNRCKQWLLALQKEEEILVGYYMVTEWSKRLKCPHLHLLMGNLADVSRSRWWHWWWYRYGGARILPYQAGLGVNSYLTKYISKEVNNYALVHIKNLNVVNKVNNAVNKGV